MKIRVSEVYLHKLRAAQIHHTKRCFREVNLDVGMLCSPPVPLRDSILEDC